MGRLEAKPKEIIFPTTNPSLTNHSHLQLVKEDKVDKGKLISGNTSSSLIFSLILSHDKRKLITEMLGVNFVSIFACILCIY